MRRAWLILAQLVVTLTLFPVPTIAQDWSQPWADEEDRPIEGPLTGSQYVITGTLESMSREDARSALEALGAKVSDNVSKKTTAVFVGESPGSKVAKAQKAGVSLRTESELRGLLDNPSSER